MQVREFDVLGRVTDAPAGLTFEALIQGRLSSNPVWPTFASTIDFSKLQYPATEIDSLPHSGDRLIPEDAFFRGARSRDLPG